MKLNQKQIERLTKAVFQSWKAQQVVTFKEKEEKVFARAVEVLTAEFQREADLEIEVNRMLDELERQNPGAFERYRMYPLLKKRLAKEKGIIL